MSFCTWGVFFNTLPRFLRRGCLRFGLAIFAALRLISTPAIADEIPLDADMTPLKAAMGMTLEPDGWTREAFSGSSIFRNSRFEYAGAVAHFADKIYEPGFRLRSNLGHGKYVYLAGRRRISVLMRTIDISGGYQFRQGDAILKLYAGGLVEDHILNRADPNHKLAGRNFGIKAAAEGWITFGTGGFASFDGSLSSIGRNYWTQARVGHHILYEWGIGVEAGATGNQEYHRSFAGVFLRGPVYIYDMALSGGIAKELDKDDSYYASLSVSQKF